jgi:hypothetical protein
MDEDIEVYLNILELVEDKISDIAHENIKLRVSEISRRFPKRIFRIVSGHGSLSLNISGKPRYSLIDMQSSPVGGSYYTLDWDDNGEDTIAGLFKGVFEETLMLSEKFSDGYAYISGHDFSYQNGKELPLSKFHEK